MHAKAYSVLVVFTTPIVCKRFVIVCMAKGLRSPSSEVVLLYPLCGTAAGHSLECPCARPADLTSSLPSSWPAISCLCVRRLSFSASVRAVRVDSSARDRPSTAACKVRTHTDTHTHTHTLMRPVHVCTFCAWRVRNKCGGKGERGKAVCVCVCLSAPPVVGPVSPVYAVRVPVCVCVCVCYNCTCCVVVTCSTSVRCVAPIASTAACVAAAAAATRDSVAALSCVCLKMS